MSMHRSTSDSALALAKLRLPAKARLPRRSPGGGPASLPDENSLVEREIESQPWLFRRMFRAMADDYDGLSRRASEAMPRVLFILIPALAAVLALFYRGRHYPEHLYLALHVGAFVFIVLTLEALALYTRSLVMVGAAQDHRCARHRRLRRRGAASCLWRLVAGDGSEGARRERDLRSAVVVDGTGSHVMGVRLEVERACAVFRGHTRKNRASGPIWVPALSVSARRTS